MLHLDHQPDLEGNQLLDMIREIGMMVFFMAIAFHAMDMVIEL